MSSRGLKRKRGRRKQNKNRGKLDNAGTVAAVVETVFLLQRHWRAGQGPALQVVDWCVDLAGAGVGSKCLFGSHRVNKHPGSGPTAMQSARVKTNGVSKLIGIYPHFPQFDGLRQMHTRLGELVRGFAHGTKNIFFSKPCGPCEPF